MATTTTHSAISGIDFNDKVIAPNERVYIVRDTYTDGYGTQRVKLRASPKRQMYLPLHHLNQMVRGGDWEYVATNE